MRIAGRLAFNAIDTPASVPPVPQEQVKASTLPSVWRQISGPVVARWPSRLAVLSNWLAQTAPNSPASRSDVRT